MQWFYFKQRTIIFTILQTVSFTKNSAGAPEILDTSNYYPFGLNHTGGNGLNSSGFGSWQSYKYNGKELQETGMYDYGARFYMSDIGRWSVVDPLAENMRRHFPYNYAFNNPANFIDPDGMAPGKADGQLSWMDGSGHWNFDPATTIMGGDWFGGAQNMFSQDGGGGSGNGGTTYYGLDGYNYLQSLLKPAYDFSQFDFSQFGNNSPDDIIIRNKKGNIMYRIISDIEKDVYIDTDTEIGNPMTINLSDYEKKGAHAVGFSLDYSGTMGGGMNGGLAFVYFIKGGDDGSGFVYGYKGGNTGFEGSVGISKFYSTYVDSDKKNFNAEGYSGKSSGHAFGVGVLGYSKSWGNRTNEGELWPGQRSKTTWVTISNGVGHGASVGAKVFWSDYTLLKKLF